MSSVPLSVSFVVDLGSPTASFSIVGSMLAKMLFVGSTATS